ncbi:MAG TPA: sigma 54-interacting transcriptional regulator, partial [Myxococcales bacterium]|nr:sigma 54-interacting transcriptional regulator [Myxococcales bacterium]
GTTVRIEIEDGRMSGTHARLQRVLGEWMVEDASSKNGTFLDGRRIDQAPLRDGALLEMGHSFVLFRASLAAKSPDVVQGRALDQQVPALRTLSPALESELERLVRVAEAESRVPILLFGETGTGKEVAARAVHHLSKRGGPFVAVNCGALPATLVESELFGFRKGAFSGATEDRPGLVRSADGGTLFLDEIGDLPLPAQAALLRVLQEGEVHPIGAAKPVPVDLRVVAATHRDLEQLAKEEKFRADLLARLSGFTLRLPPLRERREDFGVLMAALLRKLAADAGKVTFSSGAARALLMHDWPLNVRELEKCLATAFALVRDGHVDLEHLPAAVRSPPEAKKEPIDAAPAEPLSEDDRRRRDELIAALRAHDGNITAAARALNKPRTQLQRWLRRWKIDPLAYRR